MLVVFLHSIGVIEDYMYPTNNHEFFITHLIIYTIYGHDNHDIFFFFRIKYTNRDILHIIVKCIHGHHLIVG